MIRIIYTALLFFALSLFIIEKSFSLTKEEILSCVVSAEPRNKVDMIVKAQLLFDGKFFQYDYTLISKSTSSQKVVMFSVDPFDKRKGKYQTYDDKGIEQKAPTGWNTTVGLTRITALWGSDKGYELAPGGSVTGFSYITPTLPGIMDYYAEGLAPIPEVSCEFDEPIPGYDDLTPYGPGVVGKTIGPTAPPADFEPIDFLNYIINMKHETFSLGWIPNKGIEQSLDVKLNAAKKKIEVGDIKTAQNILSAFLNELEAQKKHLTSEAYGLLRYNVEYLRSSLL
ncbi:MAG: hypothetical protein HZB79_00780 [Deltaproteobacteria bacterium]|nr:hypothetical protein [Deltaproteobacteria bacterium]